MGLHYHESVIFGADEFVSPVGERVAGGRSRAARLPLAALIGLAALAVGQGTAQTPAEPAGTLGAVGGTARVDLLAKQAAEDVERAPERARANAGQAIELARQLAYREGEAAAHYAYADASRAASRWVEALEHFEAARRLHAALGHTFEVGRCLRRLGDVHFFLRNHDQALGFYYKSLRLFEGMAERDENAKARLHVGHLYTTIANVLHQARDLEGAAESYRQAVTVYEAQGFALGVAGARCNLGSVLQDLGQLQPALEHFEAARRLAAEAGDSYLLTISLTNLGGAYLELGQLDAAMEHLERSNEICRRTERKRGILANLAKIAAVQARRGQVESALATYREASAIAAELSDRAMQGELAKASSEAYERLGDTRQALAEFQRHAALSRELLDEARAKQVDGLRIAYEVEGKEKAIRALQQENASQARLRGAASASLLAALGVLALLFSRYRLKREVAASLAKVNTDLAAAYERVEELSRTDELTGLPNRRAAAERFAGEMARESRNPRGVVLILGDLDEFKRVNDAHGHERGDQLLREVALLLRAEVRTQDFLARWGGEEFVLVLPETDLAGGVALAEALRRTLETARLGELGGTPPVTVTFGVAQAVAGESLDSCLRRADAALYAGKLRGRNCVVAAG